MTNTYNSSISHLKIFNDSPIDIKILKFYSHHYQLSAAYQFTICIQTKKQISINDIISKQACLNFYDQYIHGFIDTITFQRCDNQGFYYDLLLVCPLLKLKRIYHNRVFLNKSAKDILETILQENGWLTHQYRFDLQALCEKKSVITQYQESDFHFFHRLLDEGNYHYYFKQTENSAVLFMTDHVKENGAKRLSYIFSDNLISDKQYLFNFEKNQYLSSCECTVMTNDFTLSLGDVILFDASAEEFDRQYFRIIKINSVCHEAIGFYDAINLSKQRFLSRLTLLPVRARLTRTPNRYKKSNVGFLGAKIDGQTSDIPDLDENGCYQVTYNFAEKNHAQSQRLFAIQALSGVQTGFHFPLYKETDVSMIFVEGNISQPIIFGVLPDECCRSPVTANNRTQHVIRTYLGHELVFDDREHDQSLYLQTADQQQAIHLNNNVEQPFFSLLNKYGDMAFQADKKIHFCADNDFYQVIQDKHQINIEQNYFLKTNKGDIAFLSVKQFSMRSGEMFNLRANYFYAESIFNTELTAKNDLFLSAEKDISCQARESSLHFKAGQVLAFKSPTIYMSVGNSHLEINGTSVVLRGSNISMIGLMQ